MGLEWSEGSDALSVVVLSGDFINSQTAFYGPGYPAQNGIRLLQVYQYHAQALLVFLEKAFAIYVDSEEYKGSRQAKDFSEVMITISFLLWLVLFLPGVLDSSHHH